MERDLLGSLARGQDPRLPDRGGAEPLAAPRCSRRGCARDAAWQLLWNNPRVHTPERRKSWLACHEHREYLAEFLGQRGFLKTVEPFTAPEPRA